VRQPGLLRITAVSWASLKQARNHAPGRDGLAAVAMNSWGCRAITISASQPGNSPITTTSLRGRPRGRLRGTIAPRSSNSPPRTPQGSSRSSAPARQASLAWHPRHIAFACSTSCGDSARRAWRVPRVRPVGQRRKPRVRSARSMLTANGRSAVKGPDALATRSVTALPPLEDGQFRLGRVRVQDPVGRDAEPLVRGLFPVQVDERGAG
jgi:hypothetical protein